jgi:dihydrofolate reductase
MTAYVGYIAMSLDARVADACGGIAWLDEFATGGSDNGYADFYAGIDALVMGRATFDAIAGYDWPYAGKLAYVLTSRSLPVERDDIHPIPSLAALRDESARHGFRRVWIVGGGRTQRAALDAGMFDEMRVFVLPVVLGGGPLLVSDGGRVNLRLIDHRAHPGGLVEIRYAVTGRAT